MPSSQSTLSSRITAFATVMASRLTANAHKPGWRISIDGETLCERPGHLLDRLQTELAELRAELERPEPDPLLACEKAADVANYAFMIADVLGTLEVS